MPIIQSRRSFVTNTAVVGAAGLGALGAVSSGGGGKSFAAEPPPETTTIRLVNWRGLVCTAPQWVAEELLRVEGFTDIRYIEHDNGAGFAAKIASNDADFTLVNPVELLPAMDAGVPITAVSGVHVGCVELFANQNVRAITDLRRRVVGLRWGVVDRQFVSIMVSYVGLDPTKDIDWVAITDPSVPAGQLLTEGKIDAFVAVPPEPQELRARNIGHVIVNWSMDRPWSEYFCCMLAGNSEFIRKNPVATKRTLRAILKAVDLCASEPNRVAQLLVDRGYAKSFEYAVQSMTDVRYDLWRDYDAEDTMRFYALRMHEAGLIKSSPPTLIAEHSNWRFLNELKRELKV
jgi:NitT/TauT family transport system substrate-binding protein